VADLVKALREAIDAEAGGAKEFEVRPRLWGTRGLGGLWVHGAAGSGGGVAPGVREEAEARPARGGAPAARARAQA
jgi:hypothetical protein